MRLTEAYPEAVLLSACASRGQREGRGRVEGLILLLIRRDSQPQHLHQVPAGHPRIDSRFQPGNIIYTFCETMILMYKQKRGGADENKNCFSV